MDITLRLSDEELEALRTYADAHGISVQDAAREAVRQLTHETRRDAIIDNTLDEDAELLHRLAQ